MPAISFQAVSKVYPSPRAATGGATFKALDNVSFDIEEGEFFGLLGPNGAGKTTTLRLALGLTQPDNGTISLLDFAVPAHAREARARVGVVPQLDNLDPDFTLRENLLAAQENVPDSALLELCQSIGLMPLINAHNEGLSMPLHNSHQGVSAGQRQLIGLARSADGCFGPGSMTTGAATAVRRGRERDG